MGVQSNINAALGIAAGALALDDKLNPKVDMPSTSQISEATNIGKDLGATKEKLKSTSAELKDVKAKLKQKPDEMQAHLDRYGTASKKWLQAFNTSQSELENRLAAVTKQKTQFQARKKSLESRLTELGGGK